VYFYVIVIKLLVLSPEVLQWDLGLGLMWSNVQNVGHFKTKIKRSVSMVGSCVRAQWNAV